MFPTRASYRNATHPLPRGGTDLMTGKQPNPKDQHTNGALPAHGKPLYLSITTHDGPFCQGALPREMLAYLLCSFQANEG